MLILNKQLFKIKQYWIMKTILVLMQHFKTTDFYGLKNKNNKKKTPTELSLTVLFVLHCGCIYQ